MSLYIHIYVMAGGQWPVGRDRVLENEISQRGRFNGNCRRKRQDKASSIETIELVSMYSRRGLSYFSSIPCYCR